MNGYQAYLLFIALKNHFTKAGYDFFKYHGKVNASVASYEKRRDRWSFARLAKEHSSQDDLTDLIVANLIKGRLWVGDMLGHEAEENYLDYVKRYQSISYIFAKEIEGLFKEITRPSDLFRSYGGYPFILKKYTQNEIGLETFLILDEFLKFSSRFNDQLGTDDIVWKPIAMLMIKFKPFLKYDRTKLQTILKEKIIERFADQIKTTSETALRQTA